MMVTTWWHVFFRVANFGIFVGFLVYLYQRYAKDFIARGLEQEKQLCDGLRKEHEAVVRIHDEYQDVIVCRQKELAVMRSMVKRWREAVAQEHEQRAAERDVLAKLLQHKADRQAELLQTDYLASVVVPPALKRARKDLTALFADEQEGRAFLVRIFNRMEG